MPRRSFDMDERFVFDHVALPSQSTTQILSLGCTSEYSSTIITYVQMRRRRMSWCFLWAVWWWSSSWIRQFLVLSCSLPDKKLVGCIPFENEGCLLCLPMPTSLCRICTMLGYFNEFKWCKCGDPITYIGIDGCYSSTPSPTSIDVSSACTLREHSRLWVYQLLLRWWECFSLIAKVINLEM